MGRTAVKIPVHHRTPRESVPRLNADDIIELGEKHLAEITETQRPHPAKAEPERSAQRGWWLHRLSVRVGVGLEHIRRRARSPRYLLGRRLAWLRVLNWKHWLDVRVLCAFAATLLFAASLRIGLDPKDIGLNSTTAKTGLDLLAGVFGLSAAAAIGLLWNDFVRCPFQARRMRRRIRKRPVSILPTAPTESEPDSVLREDPLESELIARPELYDEVLPGILRKNRRDVQIIVGSPGSGKTTALIGLAGLLARVGMLPVFVPFRGEEVDDVVDAAREAFEKQVRAQMRITTDWNPLWRWLCARKRVVVLIDDIDQISADREQGFTLRRTLEQLATRDVAVIVTARPAGIPAGVSASSIELGPLDEDSVVQYVRKAAQKAPVAGRPTAISEREIRRWVQAGQLAEIPFYLELLACLCEAGSFRALPSAELLYEEGEHSGRFRRRPGGGWEWNPIWVRFRLLELFYEGLGDGSIRRWLGIERRERRSTLELLEDAALGHLLAIAREAKANDSRGEDSSADEDRPEGTKLQDFIGTRDREEGRRPSLGHDKDRVGQRRRVSVHEAVDAGERLRILDRDHSLQLQFRHRLLQAYMAGRRLTRGSDDLSWLPGRVGDLLDRRHPEKLTAHMTLTFAALHAERRARQHQGDGKATGDEQRLADETRSIAVNALIAGAGAALHPPPQQNGTQHRGRDPLEPELEPGVRRDPDEALINLTTAATIVHALSSHELPASRVESSLHAGSTPSGGAEEMIVTYVGEANLATRWTKLNAIASIASLEHPLRWDRIWEYARDRDYTVRRAAAKELQRNAHDAYGYLSFQIERLTLRAAARSALDLPIMIPSRDDVRDGADRAQRRQTMTAITPWTLDDVFDLTALGWVLPAIVSGLSEDPSQEHAGEVQRAQQALERVVALAFEGGHHDFEASVAQGFKDDAMRHARDSANRISGPGWVANNRRLVAEICLEHAEFWYARMLLYQALALYAVAGANRLDTHMVFARLLQPSRERHAFAREAAKLAQRSVERKQVGSNLWEGLVWDDEGETVARRANTLDDRTAQLVADVTLLLNLNEQRGEDAHVQFGQTRDLPHCLSISKDRREILGAGCPSSCGWGLCPYEQAPPDEPNAHRGVSRAFCRQQQQIASRRHRPSWQREMRKRPLERFWREVERRART